ncbi:galactoside O-acetyltransferase [Pedobacter glucosidilyticus]|nr:acyltransferase [Pedobacter glucosidilyticus]KHJ39621.1 galactoside O-acetyltransferase [Pedobacter glucosidilyticus]
MLSKLFRVINECLTLDFFTMLKLKSYNISSGKVFFFTNSKLTFSKDSKILAKEGFYFNKSWTPGDPFPSLLHLGKKATLIINGKFKMHTGTRVYINENASLILGSGFSNNNLNISCFEKIEIGNDVIISENVTIRDSDNHSVKDTGYGATRPIKIGNNVWIGINVTILKGVTIGDGAVIAAGSLVNKNIPTKCLSGGVPSKIIRENIVWVR